MLNQFDPQHQTLLEGIQGNILKSHGRHHTANLFIRFAGMPASTPELRKEAKKWLKNLVESDTVKSAYEQLRTNALFKDSGGKIDTGLFACIHISAAGYRFLFADDPDLDTKLVSIDPSFAIGMKARVAELSDPEINQWEAGFQRDIHLMLLLAHANPEELDVAVAAVQEDIQSFGIVATIETGEAIFNDEGAGIEHFGYVDGVSQPLFFEDEWNAYKENHGIFKSDDELKNTALIKFDPRADIELVLTQDVFANDKHALGSCFVFRKLEQNVKGFKQAEADLATGLGLTDEDRERAGAMLVGRFEDGTPVEVRGEEKLIHGAVFNNFDYDPADASRCPYHAHIRKTNPRSGMPAGAGGMQQSKTHIMARRGIPFGKRNDDPNDGIIFTKPEKEVGLLFMSYQASIANQFEFIQRSWVNNEGFPNFNPDPQHADGIDPVIGQGKGSREGVLFTQWSNPASDKRASFGQFVHLKGGEYFFTPSMQFLKTILPPCSSIELPA
ncbi:Dyp-type peroxidase [Arsenicibacter rosenii]|uniref:Dyp-type peroxidase C-terminal domain-containing protein n=1 Tax=Arsenicibacter rosenii TaxID=1750698 RepID=A0A1S2VJF3_9BACT|nr:hypothetical protein [Arsenicibacter rosenii]OIN58853.1 hypothetical protein BLX24_11515 [Arsenicibacter rosenii]